MTKPRGPEVPKIAAGMGGSRPGAGRKTAEELGSDTYQIYNAARAKKAVHDAAVAEMEAKAMAGTLLPADAVLAEWQNIVANVRARLLAMPSKLAARTYGAKTLAEAEDLLTSGIHEVLQELASDAQP